MGQDNVVRFCGLRAGATYSFWLAADATGRSVYATGLKAGDARVKGTLGRTITGRVTFPPGATHKHVWAHGKGRGLESADATLKPDGSFEILGVPAGTTWQVVAGANLGSTSWQASGEVAAGGNLDLVLEPKPSADDGNDGD